MNYKVKLVNNFNQLEFEITQEDYERYLDELVDEADFISYDKFVENNMRFANTLLATTVASTPILKPAVVTKKVIPEAMRPSEKQLTWAKNLGVEDPEQYDRKELGEIIKKLLAEQ